MSLTERVGRAAAAAIGAAALLLASSCGGGGGGGGDGPAERGRALASDVGCAGCHSSGTDDGLGPGWGDRWGAEIELADGRTVVVDDDYLRRSIVDPGADVVPGFTARMPQIPLSDEEIDDLTAYLREVSGG